MKHTARFLLLVSLLFVALSDTALEDQCQSTEANKKEATTEASKIIVTHAIDQLCTIIMHKNPEIMADSLLLLHEVGCEDNELFDKGLQEARIIIDEMLCSQDLDAECKVTLLALKILLQSMLFLWKSRYFH